MHVVMLKWLTLRRGGFLSVGVAAAGASSAWAQRLPAPARMRMPRRPVSAPPFFWRCLSCCARRCSALHVHKPTQPQCLLLGMLIQLPVI